MGDCGVGAVWARAAAGFPAAAEFTPADARAGDLRAASADAVFGFSTGASTGSALMMLTAGIESADGKK